jgi:hypothetical protein
MAILQKMSRNWQFILSIVTDVREQNINMFEFVQGFIQKNV